MQVNYPGLRALTEKYGKDGFRVIAFPCNQFGGQAPGTSEEERAFAIKKFGIQSLPVMVRIDLRALNSLSLLTERRIYKLDPLCHAARFRVCAWLRLMLCAMSNYVLSLFLLMLCVPTTQDKVDVNGPSTHPVYKFLKAETNTSKVPWNYWKALVDRSGQPVKSFGPSFDPLGFEGDVRRLLCPPCLQ